MHYVYLLRSLTSTDATYIGYTTDLKYRLKTHNKGTLPTTAQHRPWMLVTFLGFNSEYSARQFEKYLKSSSGRAFASKRLW